MKAGDVLFLMDEKPFKVQVDAQAAVALAPERRPGGGAHGSRSHQAPGRRERALPEGSRRRQRPVPGVGGRRRGSEGPRWRPRSSTCPTAPSSRRSPASPARPMQQEGSYISPQNSLLTTVAVLSPMWVNFSVSENEMQTFNDEVAKGRLRQPADGNFTVEVLLVDGSLFPHKGRITFAAPSYNVADRHVPAPRERRQPRRRPPPERLRPGPPDRRHPPERDPAARSARCSRAPKGPFVWVVDKEGKAQPAPVRIGKWQGDEWFVSEGLQKGEQVIVDGAPRPPRGLGGRPEACRAGRQLGGEVSRHVLQVLHRAAHLRVGRLDHPVPGRVRVDEPCCRSSRTRPSRPSRSP